MKLLLALLLTCLAGQAATPSLVGGVRVSTDTTGTNTIAANVVVTNLFGGGSRTALMLRDLQVTNAIKMLGLTANTPAFIGPDKTLTNGTGGFNASFDTVADMVASVVNSGTQGAMVNRRSTLVGDGIGGGQFYYNSASAATTNPGTVFPASGAGRWFRQVDNYLYDVTWFGAIGDDSTDNTTAINDTIAALPSVTGYATGRGANTVWFPPGVYRITAPIHLAAANQRIVFRGAGGKIGSNGTLIKNIVDSNANLVDLSTPFSSDTVSFYDLGFWGGGAGSGTGWGIVLGSTTQTLYDSTIQNCWFPSCPMGAIYGKRVYNYEITLNSTDGEPYGIWIDNTVVPGADYVDNVGMNKIYNNTLFANTLAGVRLDFVYGAMVANNSFQYCGSGATNGALMLVRSNAVESRSILIANNLFDRSQGWDITGYALGSVGTHTGMDHVSFNNNHSDFTQRGHMFIDGINDIAIRGAKIRDCSQAGLGLYDAIQLKNVAGVYVSDNVVTTAAPGVTESRYGFHAESTVSDILLGLNQWDGFFNKTFIEGTLSSVISLQGPSVWLQPGVTPGTNDSFNMSGWHDLTNTHVYVGIGDLRGANSNHMFFDYNSSTHVANVNNIGPAGYNPVSIDDGRFYFDPSGNKMGVGDNAPSYALSLGGSVGRLFALFSNPGGANVSGLTFTNTNPGVDRVSIIVNQAESVYATLGGNLNVLNNITNAGTIFTPAIKANTVLATNSVSVGTAGEMGVMDLLSTNGTYSGTLMVTNSGSFNFISTAPDAGTAFTLVSSNALATGNLLEIKNSGATNYVNVNADQAATNTPITLNVNGTLYRVHVGAADSGGTGLRALTILN